MSLETAMRNYFMPIYLAKNQITIPHISIDAGAPKNMNAQLTVSDDGVKTSGSPASDWRKEDLFNYARWIDGESNADGSHRDMLVGNGSWRTFYGESSVLFLFTLGGKGVVAQPQMSLPCMACGIWLPNHLIQVDHRHAVVGGERLAVCKVLRLTGHTVGAPTGKKASTLLNFPNPSPRAVPKGVAITGAVPAPVILGGSPKGQRYTLTDRGSVLYSLLVAACGKELYDRCLNHFVNLQPMCSACNTRKSNK